MQDEDLRSQECGEYCATSRLLFSTKLCGMPAVEVRDKQRPITAESRCLGRARLWSGSTASFLNSFSEVQVGREVGLWHEPVCKGEVGRRKLFSKMPSALTSQHGDKKPIYRATPLLVHLDLQAHCANQAVCLSSLTHRMMVRRGGLLNESA